MPRLGSYEIMGDLVFYDVDQEGGGNPRVPFSVSVDAKDPADAVKLLRTTIDESDRPDKLGYVGAEISRIICLREPRDPENIYSALPEGTGRISAPRACRYSARTPRKGR